MQFLFKHALLLKQCQVLLKRVFNSSMALIQDLGFYSRAVSIRSRLIFKLSYSIQARFQFKYSLIQAQLQFKLLHSIQERFLFKHGLNPSSRILFKRGFYFLLWRTRWWTTTTSASFRTSTFWSACVRRFWWRPKKIRYLKWNHKKVEDWFKMLGKKNRSS